MHPAGEHHHLRRAVGTLERRRDTGTHRLVPNHLGLVILIDGVPGAVLPDVELRVEHCAVRFVLEVEFGKRGGHLRV